MKCQWRNCEFWLHWREVTVASLRSLPFLCHPTRKRGSRLPKCHPRNHFENQYTFGSFWRFLFLELLSESQRIENRCTHFGVLWCCYLTQNVAVFWCILVLLYTYLNLERMKSDTCFDVFRCILKSILILMQLYEPRDSPFCSIEVSELFTGNRSLTNTHKRNKLP